MAIRTNFYAEDVTEEAPTPVVSDPDVNDYDKTDCYSQDIPVGDSKIAGTVDTELGDGKEEKLDDDGIPTLEQEMLDEMVFEEMVEYLAEAKIKSKEDLDKSLKALDGKPGAIAKALGWFKAIVGTLGISAAGGAASVGAATTGTLAATGVAAGAGVAAGTAATIGAVTGIGGAILIMWAAMKAISFIQRQPGSVQAKAKEAKKIIDEINKAISAAEKKRSKVKDEKELKKIEKYINQLKAGRDKAQAKIDSLTRSVKGDNPDKEKYSIYSQDTFDKYNQKAQDKRFAKTAKKEEKKAAKEAKKAAKNESTIDDDFDSLVESALDEFFAPEPKAIDESDIMNDIFDSLLEGVDCEDCCDKTVDVAGEGDGVNITDVINGVIDDEKDDDIISDRAIKPNFDGVTQEKTVLVNNEAYKVRVTATRLNEDYVTEGIIRDKQIDKITNDDYFVKDIVGGRDIQKMHNTLVKLHDHVKALRVLKKGYETGKTKHKDGGLYLSKNSTKFTAEDIENRIRIINANIKALEDAYNKTGGDNAYYAAMAANAQKSMAISQSMMAVNSF